MYLVGQLSDTRMFDQIIAELRAQNIEVTTDFASQEHVYSIYVQNEALLPAAQDIFRVKMGFQKAPEIDQEWIKIKSLPRGQFTTMIVIVCAVLYLLSFTEMGQRLFESLFIGSVEGTFLGEVRRGQVWRLMTPIFLHLSLMHILFNMLWFKDLGSIIEYKFGKNDLIRIMLISGLVSNLMQYLVSGPQFGGMSGVLYALLGYLWVFKKIEPEFDLALPSRDVSLMIIWLFLCLTGLLGPIANTAHAGGLFSGMFYALFRKNQNNGSRWGKEQLKYALLATLFLVLTLAIEGFKLKGRFYYLLMSEG